MKSFLLSVIACLGCYIALSHLNKAPEPVSPVDQLRAKDAEIKELEEQIKELKAQLVSRETDTSLVELARIYDEQVTRINQSKILLQANRLKGKEALKELQSNPPRFANGGFLRASQADQDIGNQKHRDKIASMKAYLIAVDAELRKLAAEELDLERKYQAARAEAAGGN